MESSTSVCLTFDDLSLKNWIWALKTLGKYNAKATFFIGPVRRLEPKDRYWLKKIEDKGHEIGYHTVTHPKLNQFLSSNSKDDYIQQEVIAGLEVMHDYGFSPKSFAFPFFKHDPEIVEKMSPFFSFIRGSGAARKPHQVKARLYKAPVENHLYHNLGQIDFRHPKWTLAKFERNIEHLRKHGGMGVFTGHNITPRPVRNQFHLTRADLDEALKMATDAGLKMETCQNALAKLQKAQRSEE